MAQKLLLVVALLDATIHFYLWGKYHRYSRTSEPLSEDECAVVMGWVYRGNAAFWHACWAGTCFLWAFMNLWETMK